MNIKLLDSWVRDYLQTKATAKEIAEKLSLTSVSIERVTPYNEDYVYDIEITTNRPDLASVVGIAREAAAVLPQFNISASFKTPNLKKPSIPTEKVPVNIINDKTLVHRICAVVMEVAVKPSPKNIQERLETSDIRSLNNVIDVTNYAMRTIGHPAHVFDYDRIIGHTLRIRESKKGETITTLDGKTHTLLGGDIVAEDGDGNIVDLLGVMGLKNSVVTNETKRILYFLDNNDLARIRKTSMGLAIRTEAAQLNEKSIDPELAMDALLYGIELYKEIAQGVVVSDIIDIYPNKPKTKKISVTKEKIDQTIGVEVPLKTSVKILSDLGFDTTTKGNEITVVVPTGRLEDMGIPEDIVEEVARVYGYHNIPSILPPLDMTTITQIDDNPYYWENRIKEALKFWGYTEAYTYSFVSEDLYEGPLEDAIELQNPLSSDWIYMRRTLIPSLLEIIKDHKGKDTIRIFEIANTYQKNGSELPTETRMLGGILKSKHTSFYEVKGLIEQLLVDLGIKNPRFSKISKGGSGADIFIGKERLGEIEVLDEQVIDFELNFEILLQHATTKKIYTPINKYPPVVEDISLVLPIDVLTGDVIDEIKKQSNLITEVTLLDVYESNRTFHIVYQHPEKNLTTQDTAEIREKIIEEVKKKFKAEIK